MSHQNYVESIPTNFSEIKVTTKEKIPFENKYIDEARKILTDLNIRNQYIIHLFRLHKINLNDFNSSKKSFLKAIATLFFIKSSESNLSDSFLHWRNCLRRIPPPIRKEQTKINSHPRSGSVENYSFSENDMGYYIMPVLPISQLTKNRIVYESGLHSVDDLDGFSNNYRISENLKRNDQVQGRLVSNCQLDHGEAVLKSKINRGKNNYNTFYDRRRMNENMEIGNKGEIFQGSQQSSQGIVNHISTPNRNRLYHDNFPIGSNNNFIEVGNGSNLQNERSNLAKLKRNLLNYLYSIFLGAVQYSESQRTYK